MYHIIQGGRECFYYDLMNLTENRQMGNSQIENNQRFANTDSDNPQYQTTTMYNVMLYFFLNKIQSVIKHKGGKSIQWRG